MGAAGEVCIPSPNTVRVSEWASEHATYAEAHEVLDMGTRSFRTTTLLFPDVRPGHQIEVGRDILILQNENVTYITEGNPHDKSTWRCKTIHGAAEIKDPCFTHNGTHTRTEIIGSTVVDVFYGEDTPTRGVKNYVEVLIDRQGVPVSVTTWNAYGHQERLFSDFNRTLPHDAFKPLSICKQ